MVEWGGAVVGWGVACRGGGGATSWFCYIGEKVLKWVSAAEECSQPCALIAKWIFLFLLGQQPSQNILELIFPTGPCRLRAPRGSPRVRRGGERNYPEIREDRE